jgi:hypothetical protein
MDVWEIALFRKFSWKFDGYSLTLRFAAAHSVFLLDKIVRIALMGSFRWEGFLIQSRRKGIQGSCWVELSITSMFIYISTLCVSILSMVPMLDKKYLPHQFLKDPLVY